MEITDFTLSVSFHPAGRIAVRADWYVQDAYGSNHELWTRTYTDIRMTLDTRANISHMLAIVAHDISL